MTLDEKVFEIVREHTEHRLAGHEVKNLGVIDIIFALDDAKFPYKDGYSDPPAEDELDAALDQLQKAGQIKYDAIGDDWTMVVTEVKSSDVQVTREEMPPPAKDVNTIRQAPSFITLSHGQRGRESYPGIVERLPGEKERVEARLREFRKDFPKLPSRRLVVVKGRDGSYTGWVKEQA